MLEGIFREGAEGQSECHRGQPIHIPGNSSHIPRRCGHLATECRTEEEHGKRIREDELWTEI